LQGLSKAEQHQAITERAERRAKLRAEIEQAAAERADYLREKVAEDDGAKDSLDRKLFDAVREQARSVGLRYDADAPAY